MHAGTRLALRIGVWKVGKIAYAVPLALVAWANVDAVLTLAGFDSVDPRGWLEGRAAMPSLADAFHATSAAAILARNPFDSTWRAPEPPPEPTPADVRDAPVCDHAHVMAIAASAEPDWSLASMRDGDAKPVLLRRGMVFGDGQATVDFIGWDRVWMTTPKGTLCQVVMFAHAEPETSPLPAKKPPPIPGIDRTGPNEVRVDRGVAERFLASPALLMKEARIAPIVEDGHVTSIELRNIRPDSPLAALGLENGDRLKSINGFDLTDPQIAIQAYARLPGADHLTVSLVRQGKPMSLDVDVK